MTGDRATIVTSIGWGNVFPSQRTWANTGTRRHRQQCRRERSEISFLVAKVDERMA
jgi:hypothetical protein